MQDGSIGAWTGKKNESKGMKAVFTHVKPKALKFAPVEKPNWCYSTKVDTPKRTKDLVAVCYRSPMSKSRANFYQTNKSRNHRINKATTAAPRRRASPTFNS